MYMYSLASVHCYITCILVNTCCVLHVVDDQLDEDDLELIKENTGVDIQVVSWHGLMSPYVHIDTPYTNTYTCICRHCIVVPVSRMCVFLSLEAVTYIFYKLV